MMRFFHHIIFVAPGVNLRHIVVPGATPDPFGP
jgi:hypothetical protein